MRRAVAAWLVLLALDVALLVMVNVYDALQAAPGFGSFLYGLVFFATMAGTSGFLLVTRRPGNTVGVLLSVGPILMIGGFLGYASGSYRGLVAGLGDPLGGVLGAIASAVTLPGILLTIPGVALVFPDGRLPGPRWRWLIRAIAAAVLIDSGVSLLSPGVLGTSLPRNPLALPFLPSEMTEAALTIGTLGFVLASGSAVVAVIVRFRRARGVERAQLKWFLVAVAAVGVLLPVSFLTDVGPADAIDLASVASAGLMPIAIVIAILRYRLYEIDRLISRGLSWGLLTVALVAVYAGVVLVLQGALAGVTQGQTLAVAASTLAAAALFQPLRARIQHGVDRRFDRARYDAERTTGALAERLRDRVDLGGLRADVAATVADALRPSSTGVWIRSGVEEGER